MQSRMREKAARRYFRKMVENPFSNISHRSAGCNRENRISKKCKEFRKKNEKQRKKDRIRPKDFTKFLKFLNKGFNMFFMQY